MPTPPPPTHQQFFEEMKALIARGMAWVHFLFKQYGSLSGVEMVMLRDWLLGALEAKFTNNRCVSPFAVAAFFHPHISSPLLFPLCLQLFPSATKCPSRRARPRDEGDAGEASRQEIRPGRSGGGGPKQSEDVDLQGHGVCLGPDVDEDGLTDDGSEGIHRKGIGGGVWEPSEDEGFEPPHPGYGPALCD